MLSTRISVPETLIEESGLASTIPASVTLIEYWPFGLVKVPENGAPSFPSSPSSPAGPCGPGGPCGPASPFGPSRLKVISTSLEGLQWSWAGSMIRIVPFFFMHAW